MILNSSLEKNKMAGAFGWGIVEEGWRKGPWTAEEDKLLVAYVNMHGEGRWNSVAKLVGLRRNGKSCRLRWVNYLRPDLKRGRITPHEENIIIQLHARWGNRWSTIARSLPGRTDNEIKNYWRTHFKKSGKSSRGLEKQKNRILKFKEQQQQRKQRQQQQQEPQQVDMKRIMSQLEESDCGLYSGMNGSDMKYICPQMASEDQSLSSIFNGASSLLEVHSIDDISWGGLWNLDDVHGDDGHTSVTSRALDQNQLSFFSPLILM